MCYNLSDLDMATTNTWQNDIYNYRSYYPGGSLAVDVQQSWAAAFVSDSKPDRSRDRKATGWLYPKAYDRVVQFDMAPRGDLSFKEAGYTVRENGTFAPYGLLSAKNYLREYDLNLVNRALVAALLNVKDQSVNLGTAWAEKTKTANGIADAATRLAKAYQYAKKKQFKRAANALGTTPKGTVSNWLELQYGWLPLLGDIYGAAEALSKRRRPDWLITGKGVVKDTYDVNVMRNTDVHRGRCVGTGFEGAFVRLDYIPTNAFFHNLSSLGVVNPLAVAWEVVPYSFLVDWVMPIGDWLNSLDATVGLEFLSGSSTQRQEVKVKEQSEPTNGNGRTLISANFSAASRYLRISRSVYWASPIPLPPPPQNPFEKNALTRMANALSLLAMAFR